MKKNIIFILTVFIFSAVGFSQVKTDANIYGHILNKLSGEHLPYINVIIKGTTIGCATDATGHYFLKNLPGGKFIIEVSGIGYKPAMKEIELIAGQTLEENFELEEDLVQLESVVVSANKNEVNRKEASTIVNVLTPKIFENTNSVCLAQGLNFQTGVRVETNCQNCGFQQVRINGLDGPYSQILIDSRPVFSALAGVYGIEQIPANMIERVEVIRGSGSALYGSNAIAGIINIITKEPTANSVVLSHTTDLIYGKSTDLNTTLNASVVSDDYRTGVMIFGSSRQRAPFDFDDDGFTEIGKIISKNIGFNCYYKTSYFSKLTIEYHNLGEFRRGGDSLDLPPHRADVAEQIEHNINTGRIKYDVFSKNNKNRVNIYSAGQIINRKSYYGAQKDPNAYGLTTDKTYVAGIQYTYSMDTLFFMPAKFTAGTEYSFDDLHDEMVGYHRLISQGINIKSIFLQNEWKDKKLSIFLGGRLDKHNLIHDPIISPRLSIRYNTSNSVSFRVSYASGFRAPQTYDEDLHVTAVGGHVALIHNDTGLKPEKSQSFSASMDLYANFARVQTNFLVEGFYTNLNDVFVMEEIGSDGNGNILLERRNGSGALVQGINIEGKIVPAMNFQLQFGVTLQKSLYKKNQIWSDNPNVIPQRRIFRTPDRYGYITVNYYPVKKLSISLFGTYTGSMLVQHFAGYVPEDVQTKTKEFFDISVKFSYDFAINRQSKLQVNTGIQNVFNSYQSDFDKGQYRDAGYIYGPSLPRTPFLGIKLMI